uniref:Uncharacterized protein n=1 Tax=Pipistrellus kuhlii TaxID=59472 RepID=A0A7J7R7Z4_PIPKU|nr:hypothetical protein mPipKuh1_010823 [Pipistrellus kuhlii]
MAQHSGGRSHGGQAGVLLLLRHWSPQKEQLQPEGPLYVLGAPPWSFLLPVPGREGWASVLSKSPSALYPPAHSPPHALVLGWPQNGSAPFYYLLGSPVEERWQAPPTPQLQSLRTGLPGTLPQCGHTFCSPPVPSFVFGKIVL